MAVQAEYNVAHHGPRATSRVEAHDTTSPAFYLGEIGGGHPPAVTVQQQQAAAARGNTLFSDPRSALTCNDNNSIRGWFVPRKRARVGDGSIMEGCGGALLPPVPVPQAAFAPVGDARSRTLCSVAASTSDRTTPAAAASMLSSHLYRHNVEADALIRIENERLRVALQEARRRHVREAVFAFQTAAARRLRDAEAELARALRRNAELEQRIQQMDADCQAWQGVAKSHEAVASGLRTTLDQLLQAPPCAEGDVAEDAQSCCFEQKGDGDNAGSRRACRVCGDVGACVLLLPCRHLCLCAACDAAAVDACPVCAATKNASLHVLLS